MRKALHLFSLLVLLMPVALCAQTATDKIVLSDLKSDKNGYYFTVNLENGSAIYTAFNMDITMPEGISAQCRQNGTPYVSYSKKNGTIYPSDYDDYEEVDIWYHEVSSNYGVVAPRVLRIACHSTDMAELTATSGELLTTRVLIDNEALSTSFCPKPIVKVSGIKFVTKDEQSYVPADFTCRPFASGLATERTLPLNISSTNKVGTLILPFSAALPQGVKAYTCDALDEEASELVLTPAASLQACTPYIVYAQNGYTGEISGTVDMTADYPATDVYTGGYLTGVLTATVVNEGYIMQNQGNGPMFYNAEGSSFSLHAGRCYLTPTGAAASKAYALRIGDETGINNSESNIQHSEFIYDLTGRRVESPTRGIYIYNGKKLVVK